ncbi:hypothetical protein HDU96_006121 [Phlyctochytrium bullatum]|nr:hypothetical protein HDU96_006121 [Phlyctochytrium bullatum]
MAAIATATLLLNATGTILAPTSTGTPIVADVVKDPAATADTKVIYFQLITGTVAIYNSLELFCGIFMRFKKYNSIYFWSMVISTAGTFLFTVGFFSLFFGFYKKNRIIIVHTLYMNIFVLILDLVTLLFEYLDLYDYQIMFKAAIYSIKIKAEFAILNILMDVLGPGNDSGKDSAGGNHSSHHGTGKTQVSDGPASTTDDPWTKNPMLESPPARPYIPRACRLTSCSHPHGGGRDRFASRRFTVLLGKPRLGVPCHPWRLTSPLVQVEGVVWLTLLGGHDPNNPPPIKLPTPAAAGTAGNVAVHQHLQNAPKMTATSLRDMEYEHTPFKENAKVAEAAAKSDAQNDASDVSDGDASPQDDSFPEDHQESAGGQKRSRRRKRPIAGRKRLYPEERKKQRDAEAAAKND